jgi:tRNA U55 pseudouridine synthase TruB
LLGSSFDRWRAAAHTAQNRRQKLDDFLENKSQRIKTTVWATWYDKLQDQLLRPAEYQVLMMRKEVAQAAVMKRWVAQTRILPAIRFRNLTLKRQALEHWASQYPRAQLVRTGREHDRRTLLAQCWKAWKGAVRDRQTWRAAA